MDFITQGQRACYERIAPWMRQIFGDEAITRDDVPAFIVPRGSAYAQVAVLPRGEDDAIIATRAYVVMGALLSEELMRFLLSANANMEFGAFGIDDEGDILFEHAIVGRTCDKEELEASVTAVLSVADEYDDQIASRWGGLRAMDQVG